MRKYLVFLYFACFSLSATSVYVAEHELSTEEISLLKIHVIEQESSDRNSLRNLYLVYPQKIETDEFVSVSIQVKDQGVPVFYANLESEIHESQTNSLGSIFSIPADLNYEVTIWLGYGRKNNKLITDYYIIIPAEFSFLRKKTWKQYFIEEAEGFK